MKYEILTLSSDLSGQDYELLDSGEGEKLERYGKFILSRPDPQALWPKADLALWAKADARFVRDANKASWKISNSLPEKWQVSIGGLKFIISPTAFKHTGVFSEQACNWSWLIDKIKNAKKPSSAGPVSVLNLFAYTGGATMACLSAGASVTHVDGSKSAINWSKENIEASGLSDKPVRYMLDDVRKFVAREIKRGMKYDGIILDPPSFGHGSKKEVWNIETDLIPLLADLKKLLSSTPVFFLINGYSSGYSAIAYGNNIESVVSDLGGHTEIGELTIAQSGNGRLLPCGIFARWSK
jgi:23S rRNA (cytosine1962-C5)-methyltransferase